jgi:ribosomal protein S18 acetylase RimI-like enzyme
MEVLLAEVFNRFDPLAAAINLPLEEMRGLVRLFAEAAANDMLTVVARSQETGRLIGAMLTNDFASPSPEGIDKVAEHFDPIAALLNMLDEQYRKVAHTISGEILHLFMLGVAAEFGGKGIAKNLVRLTLENGKCRGYTVAVTEATGNVSQHIFRTFGFAERFRTNYRDFTYRGKAVFQGIVEHKATILMERNLGTLHLTSPNPPC